MEKKIGKFFLGGCSMKDASFRKEAYFCSHCKKHVETVNKLYFVDEVPRGFCSEKCIEKYYLPIVHYYEKLEQKLREKYLITYEEIFDHIGDPEFIVKVLMHPDKLTYFTNNLGETVYSFLLKFNEPPMPPFYYIILAYLFDHRPAFILLATATTNENFVQEFLFDQLVENPAEFLKHHPSIVNEGRENDVFSERAQLPVMEDNKEEEVPAPLAVKTETTEIDMPFDIEQKKSILLAELLENRRPEDIPFEKFHLYDHCLTPTIQHPDQVFRTKDEEGDELFVHRKDIKGHPVEFVYLVIAALAERPNGQQMVIPIISFPTIDNNLAGAYCQGVVVSRSLPN